MALNIKTPEAHRLAREVAAMTGVSLSEAVTISLRDRCERLRAQQEAPLPERLVEIGRDVSKRLPAEMHEGDPTAELYDETGLPQ